jgi:hypothetical protein
MRVEGLMQAYKSDGPDIVVRMSRDEARSLLEDLQAPTPPVIGLENAKLQDLLMAEVRQRLRPLPMPAFGIRNCS